MAAPASAFAGTQYLVGSPKKYPGAKVTFKVLTNKKGTVTRVASIRIRNLRLPCTSKRPDGPPVNATFSPGYAVRRGRPQGKLIYFFQPKGSQRVGKVQITAGGTFAMRTGQRVQAWINGMVEAPNCNNGRAIIHTRNFTAKLKK